MGKNAHKHFPGINAACCVDTAYNFKTTAATMVGHLLALSFTNPGIDLKADTVVKDPENPDSDVEVVGVIERIVWEGDQTDPISFRVRLSEANKAAVNRAIASRKGGPEATAKWVIYQYAYEDKKFFKYFHSDDKDIILEITKDTEVLVSETPDLRIQKPLNFTMDIQLSPNSDSAKQELAVAFAPQDKMQIEFGVNKK